MTPEGKIKKAIQDYLTTMGIFWRRMQSGKVKVRGGWMELCPEGTFDLLICPTKGFWIGWIETKQLKGQMQSVQKEFEEVVTKLGHPVLLARSVDDVEKWLKLRGAI